MKNLVIASILLVTVFITTSTRAQKFIPREDVRQAKELIRQSKEQREKGNEAEADRLLIRSAELRPAMLSYYEVLNNKIYEVGDIKTANKLLSAIITTARKYEWTNDLSIAHHQRIDMNLHYGDVSLALQQVKEYMVDVKDIKYSAAGEQVLFNAANAAYDIQDGEMLKIIEEAAIKYKFQTVVYLTKVYTLVNDKKYDEAIAIVSKVAKEGGYWMPKAYAEYMLPLIYYKKGDYTNMALSIETARKRSVNNLQALSYHYGLLALTNKEYQNAIFYFTEAIKSRGYINEGGDRMGKFRFYAGRAEAFAGLKDFSNAKLDYEASLLFYPNYEPALDGLARLEGRLVTEIKTDKEPPIITVTEPVVNRGLKVVTNLNNVMVKGTAPDPSGLKSVSINGIPVYSKESGDFWGSVTLQDGLNKLEVVATDGAGNAETKIFEIEKQAAAVVSDIVAVAEKQGKNYAVLIASQNYDDVQIPSLDNPVTDAVKLKMILKNSYDFPDGNVYTLFNPNRNDFKKKFLELREAIQPEDNLVIFYAGHGIWVDKEKKGYWLLTDALRHDQNTWLPNKEVLDMIAGLPARHTLLITDACFSGSVFKTRGLGTDAPAGLKELDNKISRVAITSGNDTEVPDESIFMKYLVKALMDNKEKHLTAQKMFITQIIEAVMAESKTEPRYGTLELAGHVGGDFIFSKK